MQQQHISKEKLSTLVETPTKERLVECGFSEPQSAKLLESVSRLGLDWNRVRRDIIALTPGLIQLFTDLLGSGPSETENTQDQEG